MKQKCLLQLLRAVWFPTCRTCSQREKENAQGRGDFFSLVIIIIKMVSFHYKSHHTLSKCSPQQMLIKEKQSVQSVIIIIMIIFKFRYIQTHQMPSKATNPENKSQIMKKIPGQPAKSSWPARCWGGWGGEKGLSGSYTRAWQRWAVRMIMFHLFLYFVFVVVVCLCVSICIWICICFCICLRNLGGGGAPISCSWWSSSLYHLPSQPPSLLMAPALTLMAFLFWLLNH